MATIKKRKNSYFITVSGGYDLNGKQIRKTSTFNPESNLTPKQEQKALDEFVFNFERKVKQGIILDSSIRFYEFTKKWISNYAEEQLSVKTLSRYKTLLARINGELGNIKLEKLQPHHLIEFYKKLGQDGVNKKGGKLSPKTIQHHHRLISVILKTAVQWQIIPFNVSERVAPPKVPQEEVKYFDDVQARQIIELLENEPIKYKTGIILSIYSGFRRAELIGLKWEDIDFDNKTISIKRTLQYDKSKGVFETTPKTKSSYRTIKLPPNVFTLLSEYKCWQTIERLRLGSKWVNNDYIFTQWNGKAINPDTFTKYFQKFAKKNNLPEGLHLHSLRHTNATLLIAGGMNPRTVSNRLGHAQTSTTMNIYSHAIQSADAKSAEILEDILNPIAK